jgi:hypothetical protein
MFLARNEKKYCAKETLDFRILLVLDNANAHVLDYVSYLRT